MASITRTENVAGLNYTDGSNKITVTAEALTTYNLGQSDPSLAEYVNTGDCTYEEYKPNGVFLGYLVTGRGSVTNPAMTISSKYNGYDVVGVKAGAFKNDQTLTSITIPKSVTYIGAGAFQSSGLAGVNFYDDTDGDEKNPTYYMVVEFENPGWDTPHAYYSYENNTKYTVGYGVKMTRRGTTDIYSCKVPININTISFNAGNERVKTETRDISAEVESMSGCLFKTGANDTFEGVTIYNLTYEKFQAPAPSELNANYQEHNGLVIDDRAFKGCSSLTTIELPRRLVQIGAEAFAYCTNVKSVSIPTQHRLYSIGNAAFEGCSSLNTVTMPDGVKVIGNYAFRNCENLGAIPGASTIYRIGSYAFYNCIKATEIILPLSLNFIGVCAFSKDEDKSFGTVFRQVVFSKTQTWFVGMEDTLEASLLYSDPVLIEPASIYSPQLTGGGINVSNGTLLSDTYKDYFWHRLDKMLPPEISLNGNSLSMTDRLGVAEYFHVYLNDDYSAPKLTVKV